MRSNRVMHVCMQRKPPLGVMVMWDSHPWEWYHLCSYFFLSMSSFFLQLFCYDSLFVFILRSKDQLNMLLNDLKVELTHQHPFDNVPHCQRYTYSRITLLPLSLISFANEECSFLFNIDNYRFRYFRFSSGTIEKIHA